MTWPFSFPGIPSRVLFGSGTIAQVAQEMRHLGAQRAFVISTAGRVRQGAQLAEHLNGMLAGCYQGAAMHTPSDVTARALSNLAEVRGDCLVAIGGGSAIGLSKALALRTDLPQLVLPTTYAGSEATSVLGETTAGQKTIVRDARVLPETVIYDIDLTLDLPDRVTATSGFNAMAHAVEALYAQDRNPLISTLAVEAINLLVCGLPKLMRNPRDLQVRGEVLYAAWLCGMSLHAVGMSLHHKVCHVLGGAFRLPHAETHAVILPYSVRYNEAAVPDLLAPIADATRAKSAALGLYSLGQTLDVAHGLKAIGMPYGNLDRAAALVVEKPYWNPALVSYQPIRAMLEQAWHGAAP